MNIYGAQITPDLVLSGIGRKLSANDINGINYELEETPKSTNSYFY